MAELDETQRRRLEAVIELASHIAMGDFAERGALTEQRDEIDAVIACLNIVAEDFGLERARREQAEASLHDTVEAYETAPAMFCSVDAETGRILQCNQTMEVALGRTRTQLLGSPLEGLYRPADRAFVRATVQALRGGTWPPPGDHELVTAAGATVPTLLSGTVVRGADGAPVRLRLIYRDMTDERRLEAQLLHAQKMEGIGRLAGGIAHDFNNLLTAIFVAAELARGHVDAEGAEDLEQILEAARRAAELTSHLLAFSRRTVVAPRPIDVNERLGAMDKLLRRTLGASIEIVTVPAQAPWTVVIDPARFEQVIMNLAINARDAMPKGGRLTLETQNVQLGEDYLRTHHAVQPGDYVMLAVSDNGIGMAPATVDRIFEPFFTTKDVGKGTGLGLATAWGIVRQAGGTIAVYSEPGKGATFKIYLPRAFESAEATPLVKEDPQRGGAEALLVVEDDALVRALVLSTLRSAGYEVIEACDGRDALEVMATRGSPVDLVITDVVMPRMGGRELAEQLIAAGGCSRVLFASGYTANSIVHQGVLEPGTAFIQKPFTPAALLRAVRAMLDG